LAGPLVDELVVDGPVSPGRTVIGCFAGALLPESIGAMLVGEDTSSGGFEIVCHGEGDLFIVGLSGRNSGIFVACSFICCCCRLRSFWETFVLGFGPVAVARMAWVRLDTRPSDA
jgi:hypothetical protein